ncbi:outer membrane protein [Microbulbifer variabilis]|uniref:outer membrane protein n=1 Tax=Microbulbifer variabilis TaxID=266805 RepID=UPI001CFDF430|nr:outer membrane beta-barrel protein [Microbulbifer variabilis]
MHSRLTTFLGALVISTNTSAAEFGNQKPLSFHPYISLNTGYSEMELTRDYRTTEKGNTKEFSYLEFTASESESWNSISIGADFDNYPLELRLSYSTVSTDKIDAWDFDENNPVTALIFDSWQEYDLEVFSLTGIFELSKSCQRACLYLLGGYSFGELDWSLSMEGIIEGIDVHESKSFNKSFVHLGGGFRYNFTDSLRMNTEYIQYNIGQIGKYKITENERVEFDLDNLGVWQAGVSYIF